MICPGAYVNTFMYSAIVFSFYVGEQSWITQIGFSTRAYIVSIVWIVSTSSSIPLLIVTIDRKHNFYKIVSQLTNLAHLFIEAKIKYLDNQLSQINRNFTYIKYIAFMIRRALALTRTVTFCLKPNLRSCLMMANRINYGFATKQTPPPNEHQINKLKQDAKQFYEQQVQKIVQLKNSADFEKVVSVRQPILIDFYADWCQPCKKLTPRLQSKVNSIQNIKMVKVNIDKCPQIASLFKIKSVPTVYLIYQGQGIDKIQGNVSDQELDKLFAVIDKLTNINKQSKIVVDRLEEAKLLIADKKMEEAIEILQKLPQTKINEDLIAIKQLFLCQCYFTTNKIAKFRNAVARATKYEQFFNEAPDLNQFYMIMKAQLQKLDSQQKGDPTIINLQQKIKSAQSKEDRLNSKFELVNYYKSKQSTEDALELAMDIIKQDKQWQDKKTNKLVLSIFKELGNSSPLVQKYRKIMQRLIS